MRWSDAEQQIDLVEHFAVLTGHDDLHREFGRRFQCADHRGHLDGFRAGAVNDHDARHCALPLSVVRAADCRRSRAPAKLRTHDPMTADAAPHGRNPDAPPRTQEKQRTQRADTTVGGFVHGHDRRAVMGDDQVDRGRAGVALQRVGNPVDARYHACHRALDFRGRRAHRLHVQCRLVEVDRPLTAVVGQSHLVAVDDPLSTNVTESDTTWVPPRLPEVIVATTPARTIAVLVDVVRVFGYFSLFGARNTTFNCDQ